MANIKHPRGQPDVPREAGLNGAGRVHHSRSERSLSHERAKLIRDPNRNQAGGDRGSADNTQGSQTGSEIDPVPEIPEE